MSQNLPAPSEQATPIRGCFESVTQCLELLDRLDNSQYATPVGKHSAIGAHMRHVIEHYLIFLAAVEGGTVVDYDERNRDPRIEQELEFTRETLNSIQTRMGEVCREKLENAVQVCQIPATNAEPLIVHSTVERELVFLSSHTIHHLALMDLLAEIKGAPKSSDRAAGVAFSTQDYRTKQSS